MISPIFEDSAKFVSYDAFARFLKEKLGVTCEKKQNSNYELYFEIKKGITAVRRVGIKDTGVSGFELTIEESPVKVRLKESFCFFLPAVYKTVYLDLTKPDTLRELSGGKSGADIIAAALEGAPHALPPRAEEDLDGYSSEDIRYALMLAKYGTVAYYQNDKDAEGREFFRMRGYLLKKDSRSLPPDICRKLLLKTRLGVRASDSDDTGLNDIKYDFYPSEVRMYNAGVTEGGGSGPITALEQPIFELAAYFTCLIFEGNRILTELKKLLGSGKVFSSTTRFGDPFDESEPFFSRRKDMELAVSLAKHRLVHFEGTESDRRSIMCHKTAIEAVSQPDEVRCAWVISNAGSYAMFEDFFLAGTVISGNGAGGNNVIVKWEPGSFDYCRPMLRFGQKIIYAAACFSEADERQIEELRGRIREDHIEKFGFELEDSLFGVISDEERRAAEILYNRSLVMLGTKKVNEGDKSCYRLIYHSGIVGCSPEDIIEGKIGSGTVEEMLVDSSQRLDTWVIFPKNRPFALIYHAAYADYEKQHKATMFTDDYADLFDENNACRDARKEELEKFFDTIECERSVELTKLEDEETGGIYGAGAVNTDIIGADDLVRAVRDKSCNNMRCIITGDVEPCRYRLFVNTNQMLAFEGKLVSKYIYTETPESILKKVTGGASPVFLDKVIYRILEIGQIEKMTGSDRNRVVNALCQDEDSFIFIHCRREDHRIISKYSRLYRRFSMRIEMINNSAGFDIGTEYQDFLSGLTPELRELALNDPDMSSSFERYFRNNIGLIDLPEDDSAESHFGEYMAKLVNESGVAKIPDDISPENDVLGELDRLIGLDNVKRRIREFAEFAEMRRLAKAQGAVFPDFNMHMVFQGNPGTGKTMIAKMMAKLLCSSKMIEEDKFVETDRSGLVAEYIGQTAVKTQNVIRSALGGVLFIDEAYSLSVKDSKNDFGREAIDTLVKAMDEYKDRLIVIFAGYRNRMEEFLGMNAGLRSRIGFTFNFDDYTAEDLMKILDLKIAHMRKFRLTAEAREACSEVMGFYSTSKDFGNGRFAANFLNRMLTKHAANSNSPGYELLTLSVRDVPTIREMSASSSTRAPESFDDMVGMENIREQIEEYEAVTEFSVRAGKAGIHIPSENRHIIFTGNPGTGKTTVARKLTRKLFDIGVIREDKLVEKTPSDFKNADGDKTELIISEAMGGVLFIDEAYELTPKYNDDPAANSIMLLIKAMEDSKNDLIVIFAGYNREMSAFMDSNPGIASRIGMVLHFEDLTPAQLAEMYCKKLKSCGFTFDGDDSTEYMKAAEPVMNYFSQMENFGNGRFVDKFISLTIKRHSRRLAAEGIPDDAELLSRITLDDIPDTAAVISTMKDADIMPDPSRITKEELYNTAVHEIGHAVTRLLLLPKTKIVRITCRSGPSTLGFVKWDNQHILSMTRKEYFSTIVSSMAGIAAEQAVFGEYSDGGSGDIAKSRRIAETMITQLGMCHEGGADSQGSGKGKAGCFTEEKLYSEINRIVDEAFDTALGIINENIGFVKAAAAKLCEKGELTAEELTELNSHKYNADGTPED